MTASAAQVGTTELFSSKGSVVPNNSGLAGIVYDDLIEITDQKELGVLEEKGWTLRDDGTLILKDNDGVVNWCCARAAVSENRSGSYDYGTDGDPALAAKVTNILFGYQFQKWDDDILDYVMVPRVVDTISSGAFEN